LVKYKIGSARDLFIEKLRIITKIKIEGLAIKKKKGSRNKKIRRARVYKKLRRARKNKIRRARFFCTKILRIFTKVKNIFFIYIDCLGAINHSKRF
jgi:hypothetical protein